jgi:excisionase family DNA binding protein
MAKEDAAIGFTPAQVAEALGCHVDTVRKMVREGQIAGIQFGGRRGRILILKQELIDRIERTLPEMAAERAEDAKVEAENQRLSRTAADRERAVAQRLVASDRAARDSGDYAVRYA